MEIQHDVSMKPYSTFRVGGNAKTLIICDNVQELEEVLRINSEKGFPVFFLGKGSNVIFSDNGYEGTVISMSSKAEKIELTEENKISASGNTLLPEVANFALGKGQSGLEFAAGIPGTLGGAVFMNAGAYGGEIKDVLESADVISLDGRVKRRISGKDMEFSYRKSLLQKSGEIVLSATIRLEDGKREEIKSKMEDFKVRRNSKQPLNYPSCGSFFKRPEGNFAGALIEKAGLKGLQVGGAQVAEKHAGFFINRGEATATDVINLMNLVQQTVYKKFGVMLIPEVRIIGEKQF